MPREELVPCNEIDWSTGTPMVAATNPVITKKVIMDLHGAVLSLPYESNSEIPGDEKYEGMPNIEVMIRKITKSAASGDQNAFKEVMDRFIGKPKQSVETVSMNLTYQDYLDALILEEQKDAENATAMEVLATDVTPFEVDPLEGL